MITKNGYIVNQGKIIGEVDDYQPYEHEGCYEIYARGDRLTHGSLQPDWTVMSEQDILQDKKLSSVFQEVKYQVWRKTNNSDLLKEYDYQRQNLVDFDNFCRKLHDNIEKKQKIEFLSANYGSNLRYMEYAYSVFPLGD